MDCYLKKGKKNESETIKFTLKPMLFPPGHFLLLNKAVSSIKFSILNVSYFFFNLARQHLRVMKSAMTTFLVKSGKSLMLLISKATCFEGFMLRAEVENNSRDEDEDYYLGFLCLVMSGGDG